MKKWIASIFGGCVALAALAQQPASQPTNLTYSNVKPYSFNLIFTPSSAQGYLVVRSLTPVTFTPQDGVTYQKGQGVGNATKVFYVGASSSTAIKEIFGGLTYHFAIFAYNGSGSGIDYKNTDPLTGNITVPVGGPGTYYNGIQGNSPTVLAALKTRLNSGRVFQSYTPGYINNLMNNFYLRDTVGGKVVSECQYTGLSYQKTPPYSWWGNSGNPGEFTREHALPKSWMPTGGNTDNQDGADYHNLFPVDQEKANAKRSNYPYGIVQNVTYQFMEGKLGTNSQGIVVYEPRNDIKGDVARAQFYMMTCYNGNNGTWGYQSMPTYAPQQSQDVLRTWHIQDPPDAFEKTRHEYIYSVQLNRNPFIDFPEMVDCINFNNMTLYSGCTISMGVDAYTAATSVSVYPNPADAYTNLHVQVDESVGITDVILLDLQGKIHYRERVSVYASAVELPTGGLSAGMYVLQVVLTDASVSSHKIIINH